MFNGDLNTGDGEVQILNKTLYTTLPITKIDSETQRSYLDGVVLKNVIYSVNSQQCRM